MRTGDLCRIRALENGVALIVRDPAIVKANQTAKGGYRDPEKEYAFKSFDAALKWLKENASTLTVGDSDSEFKDGFAAAIKEA